MLLGVFVNIIVLCKEILQEFLDIGSTVVICKAKGQVTIEVVGVQEMGFIRDIFKIVAGLVGMLLTLVGVIGFFAGVFMVLAAEEAGVPILVGGIVIFIVATFLGYFSRGDYD